MMKKICSKCHKPIATCKCGGKHIANFIGIELNKGTGI